MEDIDHAPSDVVSYVYYVCGIKSVIKYRQTYNFMFYLQRETGVSCLMSVKLLAHK